MPCVQALADHPFHNVNDVFDPPKVERRAELVKPRVDAQVQIPSVSNRVVQYVQPRLRARKWEEAAKMG